MYKKRALPHSGRTHETRRLFFNKITQKIDRPSFSSARQ